MYQRPSIPERINELLSLVGDWGKLALAKEAKGLDEKDEMRIKLMQHLYKEPGTGFRVVPLYDQALVNRKLGQIEALHSECTGALSGAVVGFQGFGRQLADHKRLDHVAVDCVVMVETYRAAYEKILLFNIRSAQILCAMEEIRSSVRFIHECAPDPCVPPLFEPPQPPPVTCDGDVPPVATTPPPGVPVEQPPGFGGNVPPVATTPPPGVPVEQPPGKFSGEVPQYRPPPFDDTIDWMPLRYREDFNRLNLRAAEQEDKVSELERRTIATEAAARANAELLERMREREAELQRLEEHVRGLTRETEEKLRTFELQAVERRGGRGGTSRGRGRK